MGKETWQCTFGRNMEHTPTAIGTLEQPLLLSNLMEILWKTTIYR